ncbi:MAG: hypothetical protein NT138_08700 [Planctomycetales bacterium]|nr:hypothetical protein [Planctomycetales bacterium]
MRQIARCLLLLATITLSTNVVCIPGLAAQDTTPTQDPPATAPAATAPVTAPEESKPTSVSEKWDRLIYVPFKELQKVFDNQEASVVLPYAEYLDLMKRAINAIPVTTGNQDAVITSSQWSAVVEKDVARISVELKINVLKTEGWATLPVNFGSAAIGKVEPNDGTVLLKGTGQGTYELLLKGAGQKSVKLELLVTVLTSPEDRSFGIQCPPTGISELVVTIPEQDQTIRITPLQVLLPTDGLAVEGRTVAKASLGAVDQFEVHWNPRAGSKPVMDLLSSVMNETSVRIEQGLLQTRTLLNYEVLRGELREVTVLVPKDARIIDVVSAAGRIRSWNAEPVGETHQLIKAELLVPATEGFQIELQTERPIEGDTLQLIGRSADGKLQGVHADAVVREAGRLTIVTDPSLTTVIKTQTGVKQIDTGGAMTKGEVPSAANTWEFSGSAGVLTVQIKPVEPRLLVAHKMQYVFRDDEMRLRSVLKYEVERAGVFQLSLKVPESLTIDNVSADGMSEFNVDKGSGLITLSLTQKRMGTIEVTIQAHQAFDASVENAEMELPTIAPDGVERETGLVTVYAPEFLDVITVDEKLAGLFPSRDAAVEALPRLRHIASWNFTRRPIALFVRTSPRPAQIAASVGTTVEVEPEIVKQNAIITFDIQNAGIDTLRVAVPEAVANDVRFRMVSPGHSIQQRDKAAQAENGWVTWTLVLQDEATGTVQLSVDWDVKLAQPEVAPASAGSDDANAAAVAPEQSLTVEPPRVLAPFADDQADRRRVTLTQTRGEIRLLRHESLSITAESQGETTEAIDVRELELMEQDGYLAYRYFAQPASATIRIRRHEIHEVAATVVSRIAVEVVTERQALASWRARLRITTSERQRLRVDLPAGSDLQAPMLNDQRTTIEKATDVKADEHWEAYYVNISRDTTSDQEFLLTLQYRCPIVEEGARPYTVQSGFQGGLQKLRLPVVGENGGSTVVQQVQLAIWAPEEIAILGEPELWSQQGAVPPSISSPLRSGSSIAAANEMHEWIDPQHVVSGDFPTQGSVAVYRAVGRQAELTVTWWSRPFLFWMISGTLVLLGLILRRTSWENRITLVLLAIFAVAMYSLKGDNSTPQYVSMAWPGILVVGGIWITGLLIGPKNGTNGNGASAAVEQLVTPVVPPPAPPQASPTPVLVPAAASTPVAPMSAEGQSLPVGTIAPAPEVRRMMNDLMRGGK